MTGRPIFEPGVGQRPSIPTAAALADREAQVAKELRIAFTRAYRAGFSIEDILEAWHEVEHEEEERERDEELTALTRASGRQDINRGGHAEDEGLSWCYWWVFAPEITDEMALSVCSNPTPPMAHSPTGRWCWGKPWVYRTRTRVLVRQTYALDC